jgi:hypothetical protein
MEGKIMEESGFVIDKATAVVEFRVTFQHTGPTVTGRTPTTGNMATVAPRTGEVRFYGGTGGWRVEVTGRKIRKGGTEGGSTATVYFTGSPTWPYTGSEPVVEWLLSRFRDRARAAMDTEV